MSYTLGFWAASVDELAARLAGGASGPEQVARQATEVLGKTGTFIDSIDHSSAGGGWFRDEFVAGTLARLIGAEPAAFLLERDLAGTVWDGYPSMGWLTKAELAEAIAKLDTVDDQVMTALDPEAEELLDLLVDILHMAADAGRDLVTIYS